MFIISTHDILSDGSIITTSFLLSLLVFDSRTLIVNDKLAQAARPTEFTIDDGVEAREIYVSHTSFALLQLHACPLDEKVFALEAFLKVLLGLDVRRLILPDHLQALVDGNIEKVLKRALNHTD